LNIGVKTHSKINKYSYSALWWSHPPGGEFYAYHFYCEGLNTDACYSFSDNEVNFSSAIGSYTAPLFNLHDHKNSNISVKSDINPDDVGCILVLYRLGRRDLVISYTNFINSEYGDLYGFGEYDDEIYFALLDDGWSHGYQPSEIKAIAPYEYEVRFNGQPFTLWINGMYTGMPTYEVTSDSSEIAYHDTTTLNVVAWCQDLDDPVKIEDETQLDFSIYRGEEFGNLMGPDGQKSKSLSGIKFKDVKLGKVRYIAEDSTSAQDEMVILKVNNSGLEYPSGMGILVIKYSKIEILDENFNVTNQLKIGLWENAYNSDGSVIDNFIDLDHDRFYVRVTDPMEKRDKITVSIETTGIVSDPANDIELEYKKTDGVYLSKSQLLVSENLGGDITVKDEDDGYENNGCGLDESKDDRTHRAAVKGKLMAKYGNMTVEANICPNAKTLYVHPWILVEPFQDVGYVNAVGDTIGRSNGIFDYEGREAGLPHRKGMRSEPYMDLSSGIQTYLRGDDEDVKDGRGGVTTTDYVNAQLRRANIAWMQAGIEVDQNAPIKMITESNPTNNEHNPLNINGDDVLFDGEFDFWKVKEYQSLYDDFNKKHLLNYNDYVTVFFIKYIPSPIVIKGGKKFYAITKGITPSSSGVSADVTYVDAKTKIGYRTLAHELGHVLTKDLNENIDYDDKVENPWLFYPQHNASHMDTTVKTNRRITKDMIDDAQDCPYLK
jgi:hypothetical protein